ncbi:MAG: L,D-transpeptidase family protein [Pseudomonadota bacterium]|nr:L,D-transpeptidase family protein [Pseudomonadota bacterium]
MSDLTSPTPSRRAHSRAPAIIGLACAFLLFAALAASMHTRPFLPPKVAQEHMEYWLLEGAKRVAGEVRLRHLRNIEPFYLRRDYMPVWLDNYELTAAGKELLELLRETAVDDWRNYGYSLDTLEREMLRMHNQPEHATAIEVLLTDAFLSYAEQSLNNELLPDTGEADHPTVKKVILSGSDRITPDHLTSLLTEAVRQNRMDDLLASLAPQHEGYRRLRAELSRYRAIDRTGVWRPLPHSLALSAGDRHADVPYLRWLLDQYGDLPQGALSWLFNGNEDIPLPERIANPDLTQAHYLFDGPLRTAMSNFQERHNLKVTGTLTPETISQLNIPPYQVAQRIALNMKRWRHLPDDLGKRHIMVNMADFRLELVNQGQAELDMKVIVGNLERRTPVMTDLLRIIDIAPTWTVPHRIAGSYLLPKLKRNPNYLHQKGFDVIQWRKGKAVKVDTAGIDWKKYSAKRLPYTFVQRPGKDNALGRVKFLFPNDQSIYLHDTSQPQLFKLDKRALSSGCVRVEKPRELAEKLLAAQGNWERSRIDDAIDRNRTNRIRLKEPVPVHLMYWTTWVDDHGRLQVRDDIYQRDLIGGTAQHASL